jgi:DNA-binding MarR family transcriptional regulator
MSRQDTFDAIERFCATPKTSREIAKHLGIDPSSVYGYLSGLQRRKRLEKRGDDKHRVTPATFVTLRPEAVTPVENDNLMIVHAHNPFGLRP